MEPSQSNPEMELQLFLLIINVFGAKFFILFIYKFFPKFPFSLESVVYLKNGLESDGDSFSANSAKILIVQVRCYNTFLQL